MMGRQTGDQSQLFYLLNLERRIPAGHLLRQINPVVSRILGELRGNLTPFYSDTSLEADAVTIAHDQQSSRSLP